MYMMVVILILTNLSCPPSKVAQATRNEGNDLLQFGFEVGISLLRELMIKFHLPSILGKF